jgi:hypothetical protein
MNATSEESARSTLQDPLRYTASAVDAGRFLTGAVTRK